MFIIVIEPIAYLTTSPYYFFGINFKGIYRAQKVRINFS